MESDPIDKAHKIFRFMESVRLIGKWVIGVGTLVLLAVSLIAGNAALFFTLCIPVGLAALSIWDRRRCKKNTAKAGNAKVAGMEALGAVAISIGQNLLPDNERMTSYTLYR